jgi:hypothetical protein
MALPGELPLVAEIAWPGWGACAPSSISGAGVLADGWRALRRDPNSISHLPTAPTRSGQALRQSPERAATVTAKGFHESRNFHDKRRSAPPGRALTVLRDRHDRRGTRSTARAMSGQAGHTVNTAWRVSRRTGRTVAQLTHTSSGTGVPPCPGSPAHHGAVRFPAARPARPARSRPPAAPGRPGPQRHRCSIAAALTQCQKLKEPRGTRVSGLCCWSGSLLQARAALAGRRGSSPAVVRRPLTARRAMQVRYIPLCLNFILRHFGRRS